MDSAPNQLLVLLLSSIGCLSSHLPVDVHPFFFSITPVHQSLCLVVFDLTLLSPNQLLTTRVFIIIIFSLLAHLIIRLDPQNLAELPRYRCRCMPCWPQDPPLRSSSITAAFHASSYLLPPRLYAFFLSTSSFHILSLIITSVLPTLSLINSALRTFGPSSLSVSS